MNLKRIIQLAYFWFEKGTKVSQKIDPVKRIYLCFENFERTGFQRIIIHFNQPGQFPLF